jgi:hypothetical protein
MNNCESIRLALGEKLLNGEFVTDKSGVKCIEIIEVRAQHILLIRRR